MKKFCFSVCLFFATLIPQLAMGSDLNEQCSISGTDFQSYFEQYIERKIQDQAQSSQHDQNLSCIYRFALIIQNSIFSEPGSEEYSGSLNFIYQAYLTAQNQNEVSRMTAIEDLVILLQNKWILLNYASLMRIENSNLATSASLVAASLAGAVMIAHLSRFQKLRQFSNLATRKIFFRAVPYSGHILRATLGPGLTALFTSANRSSDENTTNANRGTGRGWVQLYPAPMEVIRLQDRDRNQMTSYDDIQFTRDMISITGGTVVGFAASFLVESSLKKILSLFPRIASLIRITPAGIVVGIGASYLVENQIGNLIDEREIQRFETTLLQQRENFSSANSSWNNLVTGSEVVNTQILKSSYVLEPVFRNIYQTIRQFRQTLICGGLYTMLSQAEALSQRSRDRSRIHLSTMINHSQSRFQSDLTRILEGALPRIQHHQNETSETLQLLKSKNEPLISDGIARLELIFSYSNRNLQMDYISQKVLRTIQPDIEQLRLIETRLLSNPSSLDVAMVNQLKQNLNCR